MRRNAAKDSEKRSFSATLPTKNLVRIGLGWNWAATETDRRPTASAMVPPKELSNMLVLATGYYAIMKSIMNNWRRMRWVLHVAITENMNASMFRLEILKEKDYFHCLDVNGRLLLK